MASITSQYRSNSNKILYTVGRGSWGLRRDCLPGAVGLVGPHEGGARVGPVGMGIVGVAMRYW